MAELADIPTPQVVAELTNRFGSEIQYQSTVDDIPNVWVPRDRIVDVMRHLKPDYPMLFDVSAIDEREIGRASCRERV